jgi:hypothetical protein
MATYEMAHSIPGRMRLRVDDARGDGDRLDAYRDSIADMPGVQSVTANPRTGSLLVHYDSETQSLLHSLSTAGLVLAAAAGQAPALRQPEEPVRSGSGAGAASRSAPAQPRQFVAVLLFGLAAVQAARGEIMVPAATLLWYAFHLLPAGEAKLPPGPA